MSRILVVRPVIEKIFREDCYKSCINFLNIFELSFFHYFQQHKKVLDKYGKPDDVIPGVKNLKEPLPPTPLSGMNKSGGKVRLTFKLELDQLWIGTKGEAVQSMSVLRPN